MTFTDPLVSLENVTVSFDEESALMQAVPDRLKERVGWTSEAVQAVDDVSLDIGENDLVAVVGESGSGKTTLGKTAIALQEPTAGTVTYRGYDVWEAKQQTRVDDLYFEDIRKALQIVHQDAGASLNPYRTLMTTLRDPLNRWFPALSSADKRERVLELLRACGLTPALEYEDRYPHELSGGEQQRAALVRAMLLEPDLIFTDEPVSALDTSLRVDIMDLMLELQAQFDTSFLVVSHNLEHARYLASKADGRIAIMYLGEIVEIGPAEEVIQNPKHPYTKVLKWATLPTHPAAAREALAGESPLREFDAPDVTNPPSGCRFHPRCPKARAACVDETPGFDKPTATDHRAACFRTQSMHEYWQSDPLDEAGERDIPD